MVTISCYAMMTPCHSHANRLPQLIVEVTCFMPHPARPLPRFRRQSTIVSANSRAVPAAEPLNPDKRGRSLKPAKPRRDPAVKSSSEPPGHIAHVVDDAAVGRRGRREPGGVSRSSSFHPECVGEESSCDYISESSFSDDDEECSLDSGVVRRSGLGLKTSTSTYLGISKGAVSTAQPARRISAFLGGEGARLQWCLLTPWFLCAS